MCGSARLRVSQALWRLATLPILLALVLTGLVPAPAHAVLIPRAQIIMSGVDVTDVASSPRLGLLVFAGRRDGGGTADGVIGIVDAAHARLRYRLVTPGMPHDVVLDERRDRAYVAADAGLQAIDLRSGRVVFTRRLAAEAAFVDQATGVVFVTFVTDAAYLGASERIAEVRPDGWVVHDATMPARTALCADGRRHHLIADEATTFDGTSRLEIVDMEAGVVVWNRLLAFRPSRSFCDMATGHLWLLSPSGGVTVWDVATGRLRASVPLAGAPRRTLDALTMSVNTTARRAYVAWTAGGRQFIDRVDVGLRQRRTIVRQGDLAALSFFAVDTSARRLATATTEGNAVELDAETGRVVKSAQISTLSPTYVPNILAWDSGRLYVETTVSRMDAAIGQLVSVHQLVSVPF